MEMFPFPGRLKESLSWLPANLEENHQHLLFRKINTCQSMIYPSHNLIMPGLNTGYSVYSRSADKEVSEQGKLGKVT